MALNGAEHERLRARAVLREHRFHSDVPLIGPLIAWARERWNSIATKWYVRPLIQQQSEFNQAVVDRLTDMEMRLQQHEQLIRQVADQENYLLQQDEQLVGRIAELESRLLRQHELLAKMTADLQSRLHDHGAWLIAQDREQSELVHDLAELRLCLVRWRQAYPALSQQPAADRMIADPESTLEAQDAQDELT